MLHFLYRFLAFALTFRSIQSARILFVPAHNEASHTKSMYPAAEAFVRGGHEVHMLQLIDDRPQECRNKAGVRDRIVRTVRDESLVAEDTMAGFATIIWTPLATNPMGILFPWMLTTQTCVSILEHEQSRRELFEIIDESWDAVFVDDFFAACGLLATRSWHERGVIIVDFSTTLVLPTSLAFQGVVLPKATFTSFRQPEYRVRDFWYRSGVATDMAFYDLCDVILRFMIPFMGARSGLWDVTPNDLARRSEFTLSSVATGLDFVDAKSPSTLVLDLACPTAAALEEPYRSFVEDPRSRGTILFAMGHYAEWTHAPPGTVEKFVEAFADFPDYRIVWQFLSKSARPRNVSSNVLVESWIPQPAILAHPNTRLFMSHTGLKSFREAVCARMPVLAMPMFAEQFRNTALARHRGFAGYLDKLNLTVDGIRGEIRRVLDDREHATAVRRLQDQLSDRIVEPLDAVVFHLEFLLRRNNRDRIDSYVKARWNRLSTMSTWYQADALIPFLAIVGVLFKFVQ